MVEKYRKHIYCQMEFLKDCVSRLNDNSNSRETQSALCFWDDVKQIILSPDVKLHLDYDREQYALIIRDIDKRRLNAARKGRKLELNPFEKLITEFSVLQQTGSLRIHFTQINLNDKYWLTESCEKQNAIFLINEDACVAQQLQTDYGIIAIGKQDYTNLHNLFTDRSFAIHRKESIKWDDIFFKSIIPGNCLIIVDNYILNETNSYENNIEKILEILLPQNLSEGVSYQILIITELCKGKTLPLSCKERYEKVYNIIKRIRPNLVFDLSILKNTQGIFHDRIIITNYSYITCGGGFDLFIGNEPQKTTIVNNFHLYLNSKYKWLPQAFTNLIFDISIVYKSTPDYITYTIPFLYGKRGNRIIEEYTKLLD